MGGTCSRHERVWRTAHREKSSHRSRWKFEGDKDGRSLAKDGYGWGHLVPEGETHNFNPGFSRQQKFNKLKERYSKLEEMD